MTISSNPATSTPLATQKDLQDLSKELRSGSQKDIQELRTIIQENTKEILLAVGKGFDSFDTRLTKTENRLDRIEDDLNTVKIKVSHLPTKEEFYTWMDRIVGEYKTFKQESSIISGKVSDHEGRISLIEKHITRSE